MNLGKVFTGYTLDGKEHLFYKKISYYGNGIKFVDFIDLETEEVFEMYRVDTTTLIPVTQSLNIERTRMAKRKVKKIYKADRSMLIDTKRAFYGNIVERNTWAPSRYFFERTLRKNILFARMDDPEGRVMDLHKSYFYPKKEDSLNGLVAEEVKPINYQQFDKQMQPKRKVLEMDYRKAL